jgi:hypothetical protein
MTKYIAIMILTLTSFAAAQVVVVGGPAPSCVEVLKDEKVRPNLIVKEHASIRGTVTDATGFPLTFTRVELRKAGKSVLVRETDAKGRFTLGDVADGEYRLIFRKDRVFQQVAGLECMGKTMCDLVIELKVNGTDLPGSYCPPQ